MGCFFCRSSGDGRERWWIEVNGKGDKQRLVPTTDELMIELMRYRRALGLSTYPLESETLPADIALIGRNAAARLRAPGAEWESAAAHLEKASSHWLGHTTGTHQSDLMDLQNVRDNLGHESVATTSIYLHTADDARHDATSIGHRVDWSTP